MRKILSLTFLMLALIVCTAWAQDITDPIIPSTDGNETVYYIKCHDGNYFDSNTSPTQTADNYGEFALYKVDGVADAYYIKCVSTGKWLTYDNTKTGNDGKGFVQFSDTRGNYFNIAIAARGEYYSFRIRPYNDNGEPYNFLNWHGGTSGYTQTIGLWNSTDGYNVHYTFEQKGVTTITDVAQIENNKAYYISTVRGGLTLNTANTASASCRNTNATVINTGADANADAYRWSIVNFGETTYLYNVKTKKYLKSGSDLVSNPNEATPIVIETLENPSGNCRFRIKAPSNSYYINNNNSGTFGLLSWSSVDAGNRLMIREVGDLSEDEVPIMDVTYDLYYNNSKVATSTVVQSLRGDNPVVPAAALREYVEVSSYTPTSITQKTMRADVSWNGPFEFSTDFNSAKWYYANLRNGKYIRADESQKDGSSRYTTSSTNEKEDTYKWAFVGNPYFITIMNMAAGDGKYLYSKSTTVPEMGEVTPVSNNKARWIVASSGTDAFSVRCEAYENLYINDAGGHGNLGFWDNTSGATDGGSQWRINEVNPITTVDFELYFNDALVQTVTDNKVDVGSNVSDVVPSNYKRDFVNLTYDVSTITASTPTVKVTATWTGPFEFSADYASAHWYDMAVRSTWYVTSDNVDSDGALKTVNANAFGLAEDAYQWAFVGADPWHLRLFNKAQGNSKAYAWTETTNAHVPTFVDATNANYWWIRENTAIANAFQLTIPSYGYQVNQFGGAGGSLKIWADPRQYDAGSAFTVFDVPNDFSSYAVQEILPYIEAEGKYFVFNETAKNTIAWSDDYRTNCPYAEYKRMKLALAAVVSDISNTVLPETGYYRIKSNYYNTYMRQENGTVLGNSNDVKDVSSVIRLERDANNKYAFKLQGSYIQAPSGGSQEVTKGDTPAYFITELATQKAGAVTFWGNSNEPYSALHAQIIGGAYNQKGHLVGWERNADASEWVVEDAPKFNIVMHLGEGSYWATMYAPFGFTLPEGTEAYVGTVNDRNIALTSIGCEVPANTAVVIKGNSVSVEATINDNINPSSEVSALLGSNQLQGQYLAYTEKKTNYYTLGINNEEVGFYRYNGNIKANKAVVVLPEGSTSNGFKFTFTDDDVTAISAANVNGTANLNGQYYDLQGRKIAAPAKGGLYIQNGKVLKY